MIVLAVTRAAAAAAADFTWTGEGGEVFDQAGSRVGCAVKSNSSSVLLAGSFANRIRPSRRRCSYAATSIARRSRMNSVYRACHARRSPGPVRAPRP
jgi:hypothetical protein